VPRSFLDQVGRGRIDLLKNAPTDFSQNDRKSSYARENISLPSDSWRRNWAKSGPEVNPKQKLIQSRGSLQFGGEYEDLSEDLKIQAPEICFRSSASALSHLTCLFYTFPFLFFLLGRFSERLAGDRDVSFSFTTQGHDAGFVVTKKRLPRFSASS